jgi:hypothetical protein
MKVITHLSHTVKNIKAYFSPASLKILTDLSSLFPRLTLVKKNLLIVEEKTYTFNPNCTG